MSRNGEVWMPVSSDADSVVDLSAFCEVSSHGRVRVGGKLAPLIKKKSGYLVVNIRVSGWSKMFRAHRLVAFTFLHRSPDKTEVNHLNANKSDNRLCNLEWVTGTENVAHATKMCLVPRGFGHRNSKVTEDDVRSIRAARAAGVKRKVVAEQYGLSEDGVKAITQRRTWKHVA